MKIPLLLFTSILMFLANPVKAAFVDAYEATKWSTSIDKGSINLFGAPNSISMTSSNSGTGSHDQDFTITAAGNGVVTFDWAFVTTDTKQGPKFDPFGVLLNGVFMQLTNNNAGKSQSGSYSLMVNAGDVFGFRAHSTNSKFGSATTIISNFSAPSPIPIPSAIWLMGIPIIGFLVKKHALRKISVR